MTAAPLLMPTPAFSERSAVWRPGRLRGNTWEHPDGRVESVQWVDLPGHPQLDLVELEQRYFAWVPRLTVDFVRSSVSGGHLELALEPFHWPRLIRMGPPEVEDGRLERPVLDGLLFEPGGTFGLEAVGWPEGCRLVVAVRELRPRTPRWLYFRMQVPMHERSTFAFLRQVAHWQGRMGSISR